jgi:membrane-bound ClpP family serine protease
MKWGIHMKKPGFKMIDAIELEKISDYSLEIEKEKVFNDIIAHILEVCVKNAKNGKKIATFFVTNSDSITFASYFDKISLEYVFPDIRDLLTKYHYKVKLCNKNKLVISWKQDT